MDERFRNGLILGASYSSVDQPPPGMTLDKRHTTFKDGAVVEYDRALHVFKHIAQDGGLFKYDAAAHAFTCTLPSGASFTVTLNGVTFSIDAAGNVNIKPTTGNINIKTSAFETSINAFFELFNNHNHSDVESGDDDTGPPTALVPA
jgi:phage baseplate assembly protein gpV